MTAAMVAVISPAHAATSAPAALSGTPRITPPQAGAILAADALGETLPAGLKLELIKFLNENAIGSSNKKAAANIGLMNDQLAQSLINTALSGTALPNLPALGVNLPVNPNQPPTLQQIWDSYGLAKTVAVLMATYAAPDLEPWLSAHNARTVASYTKTKLNPPVTTGEPFEFFNSTNVSVGQTFTVTTTLDTDNLIAFALDMQIVTDLIAIHSPVSLAYSQTYTCKTAPTTGTYKGRCLALFPVVTALTQVSDRLLATNPSYTFAFPLTAGEFAARATTQDILQPAYDALGVLHTQKPRDRLVSSPFAGIAGLEALVPDTGLANLGSQAPPVNFYGLSSEPKTALTIGSQNLNLLTMPNNGIPVRTRAPLSRPIGPARLGNYGLGLTAGYRAAEVRSGRTDVLVIRWHNVGLSTLAAIPGGVSPALPFLPTAFAAVPPSALATIYYDVPAGEYSLTEERSDDQGAVYVTNWDIATAPPAVKVPPTLPNPAGLQPLANTITGLLLN